MSVTELLILAVFDAAGPDAELTVSDVERRIGMIAELKIRRILRLLLEAGWLSDRWDGPDGVRPWGETFSPRHLFRLTAEGAAQTRTTVELARVVLSEFLIDASGDESEKRG